MTEPLRPLAVLQDLLGLTNRVAYASQYAVNACYQAIGLYGEVRQGLTCREVGSSTTAAAHALLPAHCAVCVACTAGCKRLTSGDANNYTNVAVDAVDSIIGYQTSNITISIK